MQVALMVPSYIDMFYPRVGIATLVDVQTICSSSHQ